MTYDSVNLSIQDIWLPDAMRKDLYKNRISPSSGVFQILDSILINMRDTFFSHSRKLFYHLPFALTINCGKKVSGGNVVHTKSVFRHVGKCLQPIKPDRKNHRYKRRRFMQCLCFMVGSVNRNIKVKGSNDLEYSNSIFHFPLGPHLIS